jgi:23S rRNA pseudouridine2605 synthase
MRINKFLALATSISRRAADKAIEAGEVTVNGQHATLGQVISKTDEVIFDGQHLDFSKFSDPDTIRTIIFNKPTGYVVSRNGQGAKTIYELLPAEYHHLKPVGRLDKDSSGLLLLTSDGELAHRLTHPAFQKEKLYEVALDKPLAADDKDRIERDIQLEDGPSRLTLLEGTSPERHSYRVRMHEGRNRQIRRTFGALGYQITKLHRTQFGNYLLDDLGTGELKEV